MYRICESISCDPVFAPTESFITDQNVPEASHIYRVLEHSYLGHQNNKRKGDAFETCHHKDEPERDGAPI